MPSDRELAKWPIGQMCSSGGGPEPGEVRQVKALPDGTYIVSDNGQCRRVRYKRCFTKCLPPGARIATPSGDVPIRDVRIGTEIWTRDSHGRRVAARVELVGSVEVTSEHHVVRLVLADGRTLTVSPEHPVLEGVVQDLRVGDEGVVQDLRVGDEGVVQDLRVGDEYDGSSVVTLDFIRYTGARTYDLRPTGATGIYWADDIPLRSTLDGQ